MQIELAKEDESDNPQQPVAGESFKALKWRVGLIQCDGRGYKISNRGRLMAQDGSITRGFYYDDRFWAAVHGVGLVDLLTAAKLRPPIINLPPAVASAADALYNFVSPEEYASDAGIQEATAHMVKLEYLLPFLPWEGSFRGSIPIPLVGPALHTLVGW